MLEPTRTNGSVYFTIKDTNNNPIPNHLQGLYTHHRDAVSAIKQHGIEKFQEQDKNVKAHAAKYKGRKPKKEEVVEDVED